MPYSNSFNLNPINTQSPVQFKAQKFQREMASKGFLCVVLVLAFSLGSASSARVIGFPPGPNPIPNGSLGPNGFLPGPNPIPNGSLVPNPKHEYQLFGYLHGFEEMKRLVPSGPNKEGHDVPPPPPPSPQHSQPIIPPPTAP